MGVPLDLDEIDHALNAVRRTCDEIWQQECARCSSEDRKGTGSEDQWKFEPVLEREYELGAGAA